MQSVIVRLGQICDTPSCSYPVLQRKRSAAPIRCPSVAAQAPPQSRDLKTLIKVCGVTSAEDARLAAEAGADLIGTIMWPRARRSVDATTAAAIAAVAHEYGAKAVGVFVDEDAVTIAGACEAAGLDVAQLHGQEARDAVWDLPPTLSVVYCVHVSPDGALQTPSPAQAAKAAGQPLHRDIEWVLVDGMKGGSGEAFDWRALQQPSGSSRGWLLAGGLTPGNVAEAVRLTQPTGVDVSSGVTGPDGLVKDLGRIRAFVDAVRGADVGVVV